MTGAAVIVVLSKRLPRGRLRFVDVALAFLLDRSVWTVTLHLFFRSVNNQYCKKVIGGMVWNPVMRRSLSVERLETKSLPSRSPPITPNWYVLLYATHRQIPSVFEKQSCL